MTFLAGQDLTAADLNALIAPTQGRRYVTPGSLVAGANTTETFVMTTGSCALEANSKYQLRAVVRGDVGASGVAWDFRIREGNGTSGTVRFEVVKSPLGGVPVDFVVEMIYATSVAEASHQWSLTVQRLGGSGNINLSADAQGGVYFIVEKIQTDAIVNV